MGWSTELFCNISYNRQTFNSRYEVEDALEDVNKSIDRIQAELRDLALMTEPEKLLVTKRDDDDSSIYWQIKRTVEDDLEMLREDVVERYKLNILLEEWDRCHHKDTGLAKYPPENCDWDKAYLCGDFVKSDKYPGDEIE